jgi:hypothetical protein
MTDDKFIKSNPSVGPQWEPIEKLLIRLWNKCSEVMPEKDGRYLVCEQYPAAEKPWVGVSSLRDGIFDSTVTIYWMPLPEPPNE